MKNRTITLPKPLDEQATLDHETATAQDYRHAITDLTANINPTEALRYLWIIVREVYNELESRNVNINTEQKGA